MLQRRMCWVLYERELLSLLNVPALATSLVSPLPPWSLSGSAQSPPVPDPRTALGSSSALFLPALPASQFSKE